SYQLGATYETRQQDFGCRDRHGSGPAVRFDLGAGVGGGRSEGEVRRRQCLQRPIGLRHRAERLSGPELLQGHRLPVAEQGRMRRRESEDEEREDVMSGTIGSERVAADRLTVDGQKARAALVETCKRVWAGK